MKVMTGVLSVAQAARVIGVSGMRVRQLCDEGRLDGIRTPAGRLIDAKSAERLASERAARQQETKRA